MTPFGLASIGKVIPLVTWVLVSVMLQSDQFSSVSRPTVTSTPPSVTNGRPIFPLTFVSSFWPNLKLKQ